MSGPSDSPLEQSAQFVKGVGPARFEKLQRLGIQTVGDLLFHFPRTYEDLSDIRLIAQLQAGKMQTACGEVVEIEGKRLADGRSVVSVVLHDGEHCLEGVWFNQAYAARHYRFGQRLAFSGVPKWYRDHWQITNPRVQLLENQTLKKKGVLVETARSVEAERTPVFLPGILPIYPLTEDLRADQLRPLIRTAVDQYGQHVAEILPPDLLQRRQLPEIHQALRDIHFPVTLADAKAARQRFVFEEFLVLQVGLALRRRELRDRLCAPVLTVTSQIDARIRRLFPFRLTADQDQAVAEVCRDLGSQRPMQRLLQADVGAGKTAVAVYALLTTVANKYQAIFMAPTEVLAQQHWRTLDRYLTASRVRRCLLTGGLAARDRRQALEAIRAGEIDLVVGTQALVQEDVQFAQLGLVVIDEQHKFGVYQRARVRRLGVDPHYLVMTATPIPRTVALTVFGDLDTSTIRQLPPGRHAVITRWMPASKRDDVYHRLRESFRQGRQAFLVCPLAEESDALDLKAAMATHTELQAGPFRDFRVGLVHGSMPEPAKDEVMEHFRRRHLNLLVGTTVLDVGVDVPNASLIVIEHAERFGLSQLHQLRGRVSRGDCAGECYLFAEPTTEEARERIRTITRVSDGFELAEHDLRLRGAGEFFGRRQHGIGEFRIGDLIGDTDLLQLARRDAVELVSGDAGLRRPEHALLRRAMLSRYGKTLDLAEVG
jgi:ATP-dependent DNA helicase RecG